MRREMASGPVGGPLVRSSVVRNVEGEIVLTLETPVSRTTWFLHPWEALDLFDRLQDVLRKRGAGP